jgi:membrane protease YdiL (CAAX protease family)
LPGAAGAASLGFLFAVSLVLGLAGLGPQQIVLALAFAIYLVVFTRVAWLGGATGWLRPGAWRTGLVTAGAAFAALSGLALFAWYAIARPDLADLVRTFVPGWPLWLLAPAAILFSLINAALEEAAYRGVLLEALDTVLGPGPLAVALQAVAFGALHYRAGFPRGAVGVGLAFVYGAALGELRRRAGGLLIPWVTHVLTDLVIVSIVLALARG